MSDLLFVNVFAVTRHRGGSEEGGWWYDRGTPLASVPIDARRAPLEKCESTRPEEISSDDDWENPCAEKCSCYELVPADAAQVEQLAAKLKVQFADEQCPRGRLSVLGRADVEVYLEEQFAQVFPQEKPRFE